MPGVKSLGAAATRALLTELDTTPKPGLVDRNGNGAHRDLSYARLEASALALEPIFAEIACSAAGENPSLALREHLGEIGRRGERVMLAASGGTNTHRGAVWALGMLAAGAAMKGGGMATRGSGTAERIADRAGALARFPDRYALQTASHGHLVSRRYAVPGARGEAQANFPHVVRVALPAIRAAQPLPDVFLHLVATVDDTCVLHRGGRPTQELAKQGARNVLRAGGSATAAGAASIRELERVLIAQNASPGGCADLLAAALFLHDVAD